jgi:hypothetical protein
MKTSDDNLDSALRAALQRKFDGYEKLPSPSAFERIMAALKPSGNWKYLFFVLAFLAATSVGLLKTSRLRVNSNTVIKHDEKKITAEAAMRPKSKHADLSELKKDDRVVKNSVSGNTLTTKKHARSTFVFAKNKSPKRSIEEGTTNSEISRLIKKSEDIPEIPEQNLSIQKVDNSPDAYASGFVITPDLLDRKSLFISPEKIQLPQVVDYKKTEKVSDISNFKTNWLLNFSTLHTYQILTVQHSLAQRFQNFSFPSGFSTESLGYKLSAGFEKNHFQFLLHYNNFRQLVSYEVAENEYLLKPDGTGGYDVVRKGTVMKDKKTLSLLGIGVNKQLLWGRSPASKYYISAGLEYSHAINSRQSIGWVNAGIGKQFLVHKTTWLSVGPYAEFSPLKTSGPGDPFYFQPYRVGLAIGIKINQ